MKALARWLLTTRIGRWEPVFEWATSQLYGIRWV